MMEASRRLQAQEAQARQARELANAMEESRRLQARQTRELVNAMERQTGTLGSMGGAPTCAGPELLGTFIQRRIAEHQQMIKTLQWFGSHLGLDEPEDDLLVRRVIYEGLNALMRQGRDGTP